MLIIGTGTLKTGFGTLKTGLGTLIFGFGTLIIGFGMLMIGFGIANWWKKMLEEQIVQGSDTCPNGCSYSRAPM